ncbi:Y-family DNA polymerase [Spiroplasma turonicum]|uniref:DNA polymerase IV n=1 Tax=Spiroplasma turonicum TaxID=216946 RepID=A0A0K1P632_9MOLU|nr:DNA polymerase IV [Spiroplasma turonicum]AKU79725.1 DNA polymerase IV [Spiroplasma turonicum]ALX70743.1 DNA polymerase IV [Spiroplasma turonicum]
MINNNQKKNKVIFLLDMDAFYAGCHIAKNKNLANTNLVVSSPNRRSIILTASYNARKYGIKAGMPIFQAEKLCNNLTIVDVNFQLYIDYSEKVFDLIYYKYTKKIEVASIDECYIDVTKVWKKYGSVKKLALEIIKDVKNKFDLSCSIGVSTNKFLAKMAVDFNKPSGVTVLLEKDIESKIWPMKIKDMFMVGEATEKILINNNIKTIKDLANSNVDFIYKILGKRGLTLWNWANGISDDVVEPDKNDLKNIGNEMTLNYTTTDYIEIETLIYELSSKVSDRAKKRFLSGDTISISLKYLDDNLTKGYNKNERKKHITKQEKLYKSTNNLEEIFTIAKKCFYDLWKGEPVLLIGVRLSNLKNMINSYEQLEIKSWNYENIISINTNYSNDLIYDLKNKFGDNVIFNGEAYNKYKTKNLAQSKYIKLDDIHLSNDQLLEKWKK